MYEIETGIMVFSKKTVGNEYFSIGGKKTNFQIKEFASHDGADEIRIDEELVEKLQIIRSYFGVPVSINSGYRTPSHNAFVGGVKNSNHVLGKAADIVVKGVSPKTVAEFAKKIGLEEQDCIKILLMLTPETKLHIGMVKKKPLVVS